MSISWLIKSRKGLLNDTKMVRSKIRATRMGMALACLGYMLLTVACGTQPGKVDAIWAIYYEQPQTVLVAAHRGGHIQVPENSLASIDEAIKAGAHIVELDVRQTKDSVLVLMHDKTLERTTTGEGAVLDYTYEELKAMRLTHRGEVTAHVIPTLEEALLRAKDDILVDIDFKADGMQVRFDAYRQIAALGMERQVLFFLYDYTEMPVLHAFNPRIKIMPRAYNVEQLQEIVESGLTDIIHIDASYYDDDVIREMTQSKGIRIWANALGDADLQAAGNGGNYQAFFDQMKHINVVQTDYPELMMTFLGQRGDVRADSELSERMIE